MATDRISGLSSVIRLVSALCKINGAFADKIRPRLTPSEQTVYDALVVACSAFVALFPLTTD
jgi:hypothetical protein